jgi:ribosomal protein S27E
LLVKCKGCGFEFYSFQNLAAEYHLNCSNCGNHEAGCNNRYLAEFEVIIIL